MVYTQERTKNNNEKKKRRQTPTLPACHMTTACRAEDKVRVAAAAWRRDLRNVPARQACAWRLKSSPHLKTTAFDFCVPHHAYANVITWLLKPSNNTYGDMFCCGAAIGLLLPNFTASYPGTFITMKISNHIVWDTETLTAPGLWGIIKNK